MNLLLEFVKKVCREEEVSFEEFSRRLLKK